MRAHGAGEQQLVDPQVGRPVGADPPVGVRQMRGPVEDLDRVLLLDGVEQAPAAVGVAGAADVLDDLDVPALGQVVVGPPVAAPLPGEAADPGLLEPPWPLPYGVIVNRTGNGPLAGCARGRRRIDLVDPDGRSAGALDRDVVGRRGPVDRPSPASNGFPEPRSRR